MIPWMVRLTEEGGQRETYVTAPGPLTAMGKALAAWEDPPTDVVVLSAHQLDGDCRVSLRPAA